MSHPTSTTSHTSTRATLPVILLALATVVSAVSSLLSALPSIAVDTHASQTQLTWIVDAYALAFASLLLPAGALGDRFGRRRTLMVGLAIFAVAGAVPLIQDDTSTLIVVRAAMGVAAALVMPATLSTITSSFPRERREVAVATWAGVAAVGAVLGLFIAGFVLRWWQWHSVFLASAVMAVVALIGVVVAVPESAAPDEASNDPLGALLSVSALVLFVYAIVEAPTTGWTSASTLAIIGASVLVGVLFLAWEARASRPLFALRHFRNVGFSTGSLSLAAMFFGFFGFILLFLQYLQLVRGDSPLEAACAMLPLPLGLMPAARGLAPRLDGRIGQWLQSALGLGTMAVALVWLSRADGSTSYWVVALGLFVLGIGGGLAMPAATTAITKALPKAEQGVASAVNDLSRELGGAVGIAALSSVATSVYRDHLDLRAIPPQLRQLVLESAAAGTHAPVAGVRSAALTAYTTGLQHGLLTAAGLLAAAAVVLAGSALLRPAGSPRPAAPADQGEAAVSAAAPLPGPDRRTPSMLRRERS
ncbi:MFS transporter [Allobranchiibius sp. GilTou38]|uniref:MFS transporter n=1 Tax=Allobranchiibius sp. GilTou38 TaxID=2815210 RepID=UPI001AA1D267|nr:MFS transporter [Allobranchiibius sp. GilTou38]MBO1765440.1 MFS transporter [Allobranchiibius sp. GilTou38]